MAASSSPANRQGKSGLVVEGLDIVVREFQWETTNARKRAEAVVVKHANRAGDRMRTTVPIDQGDLLDSITSDDQATVEKGVVYADAGPDRRENPAAWRARFIEDGTVKMPPRPFVAPAGEAVIAGFERDMENLPKL